MQVLSALGLGALNSYAKLREAEIITNEKPRLSIMPLSYQYLY